MDRFPLRITSVFVGDIVKFVESTTHMLWNSFDWYNEGTVVKVHKNRKKCLIAYTREDGKAVRVWRNVKQCWVIVPRENFIEYNKYEYDPLTVLIPPEV